MKRSIAALLAFLLIVFALSGCYSKEDIDNAYDEGYEAGRDEGVHGARQYIRDETGGKSIQDAMWDAWLDGYDEGYREGESNAAKWSGELYGVIYDINGLIEDLYENGGSKSDLIDEIYSLTKGY